MLNEGGVKFVIKNVAYNSRATSVLVQYLGSWIGYLKAENKQISSTGQIVTELITVGGRKISSEIMKRINSIWNNEELPED